MATKSQPYADNGVTISKTTLYVGDEVTITYDGLLAKSGADNLLAYVGYGDDWEENGFIPMIYEFDTFKAVFKILLTGSLNVAFKDSAENWDNNSGQNYSFSVGKKQKAVKPADDEKQSEETPAKKPKADVEEKATVKPRTTKKKKEV